MDADLKTADHQCTDRPCKRKQIVKCKCAKAFSRVAWLSASSALTAIAVGSLSMKMHSQKEGTAVSRLCISMTTLLNKPYGEPRALDTSRLCQESGPWPCMEPGGSGTAPSKQAASRD